MNFKDRVLLTSGLEEEFLGNLNNEKRIKFLTIKIQDMLDNQKSAEFMARNIVEYLEKGKQ